MAASINASTSEGVVTTGDTSGNLNLQSNGTTIVALTSTGAAVTGTLSATSNANFATTNTSGKVGIGTASPAVALDVSFDGSIQSPVAQFTRGAKKNQIGTDGNGGFIGTTSNDPLYFYTNNTVAGTLEVGGTLVLAGGLSVSDNLNSSPSTNGVATFGINYTGYQRAYSQFRNFAVYDGKSNPQLTILPAAGTFNIYAGAWTYLSDINSKENISLLEGGMPIIKALSPKRFDYITGAKNQLGWVAQDIQPVIPEAVVTQEDGTLGLKTDFIVPHLVLAMQQQQAILESLTARIAALEAK